MHWQLPAVLLGLLAGCANPGPPERPVAASTVPGWLLAAQEPTSSPPVAMPRGQAWGEGEARSFLVPAADILGFQILLNQWNRHFDDSGDYDSDVESIRHNLRSGWVIDKDPFAVNQVLHPYQGALYHGFARSAGLGYWEALAYDFVGSAVWEVTGETTPPSLNDQITTSFGGSFLGEALFRAANAVLASGDPNPGFFTELGAALISPSTGWNRLAFGERFDALYPSHDPAIFARAGVGVRHNDHGSPYGSELDDDDLLVEVVLDYGLPGKPGYKYDRPFDQFHFEMALTSSENALPENVMVQGLLCGAGYDGGEDVRGVWGLYGTYDYISPDVFSISSTALSLGTTNQVRLSEAFTMQGSCLAGVGWAAAGTIADAEEDRTYHYGVCPQGLVALRLLCGDVAMLDVTGRAYYLDGTGSNDRPGHETILRARAALVVHVYGNHGLALQYVRSTRDANYEDENLDDTFQSVGSLSVLWTIYGDPRFGVVD